MTGLDHNQERLSVLLADLLDGTIAEHQIAELRVLLRNDEAARAIYFRHMMTHAMLEWRHGAASNSPTPIDGIAKATSVAAPANLPSTPLIPTKTTAEGPVNASQPNSSNKSSTFGFLSGFGASSSFYPISFVLLLMVIGSAVQGVRMLISPSVTKADRSNEIAVQKFPVPQPVSTVVKVTAGVDCIWSNSKLNLKTGDSIAVGQSLQLASGVAEITFNVGARVIVQSPAAFSIDSSKSIRLDHGKLTAEITDVAAHGFKVVTPDASFVDQGTEFGVEVAPGGNSRVHVFRGEVDLSLSNKAGLALPTQRLLANSGARLEGDAPHVTFVEETGESYLRSMDQSQRDLHVMAYWRFEDHPVGTLLPDTNENTSVTCATVDSSFNGNDLFTYSYMTRPVFSNDVAATVIPENGRPNHSCLDNSEYPGPAPTRDVYTCSSFSHASPTDLQRATPAQWTVEASIKMVELGRVQTFVGRDSAEVHVNIPPRLAFQVTTDGHLALRFKDTDNRTHEAVADDFTITPGRWYHVVGISDGRQLRLYANALDGRGYQLVANADLPTDGSTALGTGGPEFGWTIGRGKAHNGWPGEWFKGWIDEVRVSDIALDPSEFLFAPRSSASRPVGSETVESKLMATEP